MKHAYRTLEYSEPWTFSSEYMILGKSKITHMDSLVQLQDVTKWQAKLGLVTGVQLFLENDLITYSKTQSMKIHCINGHEAGNHEDGLSDDGM